MNDILTVKNLSTSFFTPAGEVKAVRNISFTVGAGEAIGIMGESGGGKSVTALSIMNLLPDPGKIISGSIRFAGTELTNLNEKKMQSVRGNEISLIFQDPATSLNPVYTVGNQITEPLMRHQKLTRGEARKKALKMLSLAGIPEPEKRFGQYPHQFSGGMRQRVMIAMALCCEPRLLIADEPTAALDAPIKVQIMALLKEQKEKNNTSIILITHDLGMAARFCDRIIVMYAGSVAEEGTAGDIFYSPAHPYTRGLLQSIPRMDTELEERLTPMEGEPPDLLNIPAGCPFYPRCRHAMLICTETRPPLFQAGEQHRAACWLLHPDAPRTEGGR